MQVLPSSLSSLGEWGQFVLYKTVPSKTRVGKTDKFPCDASGNVRDAHDSSIWMTFELAALMLPALPDNYGIGFVFTSADPFWFIDIDDCAKDGQWSSIAQQLISSFPGAAIEVSQSGTGLHIIGKYRGDEPEHAKKNIPLHLEMYTSKRFVALTGKHAVGDAGMVHDLTPVINKYFPLERPDAATLAAEWTTTAAAGHEPPLDDERLIEIALNSSQSASSAFGNMASFRDLWECNTEALARTYPDAEREYDASGADLALACHLMFWTAGNCERVEQLMRKSALVRDKWDNHRHYLREFTIKKAYSGTRNYFAPERVTITQSPVVIAPEVKTIEFNPVFRDGYQLMTIDKQITHFQGCCYVADANRVFTPNGMMLKAEQFNANFGGFFFQMDSAGEKPTRKAYEAFTESQVVQFPKADKTCFRPEIDSGSVIVEEGLRMVNTYVPVEVETCEGDVTPFMNHLKKLMPDERDRQIILSYMASCVQQKGHKIQWAPVIQGVKGNGKTMLSLMVEYCVGKRYSHWPRADEIGEKFNDWLFKKLFIGVEEIKVVDKKLEVLEVLKPMITATQLARRAMQTDQSMHDVCANFMFTTNHKDAIPTKDDERRYAVFYTAQQRVEDLKRDGMTGKYFPDLYNWCRNGGFAHVAYFLQHYNIPDMYNPLTECQRAPETSSSSAAVLLSMGTVEQEIVEAIEEDRQGFIGGWVSSYALDKLIDNLRKGGMIPRNKRRELMHSLGYDYHPALKDGRVNNPFIGEEGKPRLYTKVGHISHNITSAADVVRAYVKAQGYLDPVRNIA